MGLFSFVAIPTADASTNVVISTNTSTSNSVTVGGGYVSKIAQEIISPTNDQLLSVNIQAYRYSGHTSDLIISLQTDISSQPSGTDITSATIPYATITAGTFGTYTATFTTPPTLVSGTHYWLVFSSTGTATDNYEIALDTSDPYSGNYDRYYSSSWGHTQGRDINGSYDYGTVDLAGCTYSEATNYNPLATVDDFSCTFPVTSTSDEYYTQAIKELYQLNLYRTVMVFMVTFFGIIFYFMIKWK